MHTSSSQDLVLLTSPPASGKTYWIRDLSQKLGPANILVISPLRALADECHEKWGGEISVMTPEEWMGKKTFKKILVFDEFHLFFYWGDTFRPLMWEIFFELSLDAELTFILTATLSETMKKEVSLFSHHFDRILWIDRGNQILKFKPTKYFQAYSRVWILNQIMNEEIGLKTKLIFCKYREEVRSVEKKLQQEGFSTISCIGGESKHMKDKLLMNPQPDFIISTTVLSHGVNLPSIQKIYFLYSLKNIDFWIQMVARGGRKGEAFEVFSLDPPEGLVWNKWLNLLAICFITVTNQLRWRNLRCFLN